jgi:hypothetical protein
VNKNSRCPDVVRAEAIHPGEDLRLESYPLRDAAEVLRPELHTLLIGTGVHTMLSVSCGDASDSVTVPVSSRMLFMLFPISMGC